MFKLKFRLTFLVFFQLVSCTDSEIKADSIKSSSVNEDTLTSLNNKSKLDSVNQIKQKAIIKKSPKFYKASCQPLCDDEKGIFLDFKKIEKYGKRKPYNINASYRNDSIYVQYDFITDCCLYFKGSVGKNENYISVSHYNPSDTTYPCDCSCDYRMHYKIDSKENKWDSVSVRGKKYKIKSL